MGYGAGVIGANVGAGPSIHCAVGSLRNLCHLHPARRSRPRDGLRRDPNARAGETINRTPAGAVIIGADRPGPDLETKPAVRVRYDLKELGDVTLAHVLDRLHLGRASG